MKNCRDADCDNSFPVYNSTQKYCSYNCKRKNDKSKVSKLNTVINKFSNRRKQENVEYLKKRIDFLNKKENKICPVTGGSTTEIHHQKGRVANLLLDERFWIAVSRKGHDKIENNPLWAKENAFSYSRLEKEIWFPVFGYDGFYECSSFGRIRSLDRLVETKSGVFKNHIGKILSQTQKKEGYLSVMLSVDNSKTRFNSHRILMQSFSNDEGIGMEVNHKNFKKNQNHINNLEWMTEKENKDHSLVRKPKGEFCSSSKLTNQKVLAIRRLYRMNPDFNKLALARKLNIQDSAIHKIINNQRWNHL